MIEIDGSFGEGGGQILRSALTLSLITGKPFHLFKVRANRKPKPGLQPQHLASVRAAATIASAKVRGAALHSSELFFEPGQVKPGKYHFPIGTAGATGLLLHTIYLPLAWKQSGPSEVIIEGGTHVTTSPCFHFLDVTWRVYLQRLGLKLTLEMKRPGFYPRGGGTIVAHIQPAERLRGLMLNRVITLDSAIGFSAGADLPDHVARRQARRAAVRMRDAGIDCHLREEVWQNGPGSVVGIIFDKAPIPTFFYGLGARGKPAEQVADEAADQAIAYAQSGAPVDSHSSDQIVLPLSLADDPSEYRVSAITLHLTTNIEVIRMFLERDISYEGEVGKQGIIRIGPKI
jgi:RNA 3'-terminal phosphate cyclase (ATP)